MIKKYFLTGLVLLMPAVLTLMIIIFVIDFFTAPFLDFVKDLLFKLEQPIALHPAFFTFVARIIIIILLCFFIFLLGVIARWFFFRSLLNLTNKILSKIPFVKTVYRVTKDVSEAFIHSEKEKKVFKNPLLVPFPSKKSFCIGFETGEVPPFCQKHINDPLTTVFVPTAPHPISGYLIMVKNKDMHRIKMTNEQAVKFTVSCGVITPETAEEVAKDD